ncbi:MAG TPA: protein-methionine-sulfoxide reductase catalytic subunit MsrP [Verrucomicrobiae bacterium]|nr:protein-methionine-sulfoxide reductase catalytic subunit MsrP [Verrucomicrobiae bacterium]
MAKTPSITGKLKRLRPRLWQLSERDLTSEDVFLHRRCFLKGAGLFGLGLAGGLTPGCGPARDAALIGAQERPPAPELYPARRDPRFVLDRPITSEAYAAAYNNFYEFSTSKSGVYKKSAKLVTHPWQVEISGLIERPRVFDIDELVRALPLEERLYRFRCVEAWAMAVPWTGFPLRNLIKRLQPLSSARYVRFVTFMNPTVAPSQRRSFSPWPYSEGLTMAEAMNELTLLATGIYGHPLPKQHGAPLRLVVPWKYGFKSIKSIVKVEFTAEQPRTFWNSNRPHEYDFAANVRPDIPHPRWSQATERLIDTGERWPTLPYNGYGEWVADLYI